MNYFIKLSKRVDPLERLPQIAQRLGVQPCDDHRESVFLRMSDGKKYDVFDLVTALLDRIETVSKP
jgi:hypothetical protein